MHVLRGVLAVTFLRINRLTLQTLPKAVCRVLGLYDAPNLPWPTFLDSQFVRVLCSFRDS